jgi:hypothetical protein
MDDPVGLAAGIESVLSGGRGRVEEDAVQRYRPDDVARRYLDVAGSDRGDGRTI